MFSRDASYSIKRRKRLFPAWVSSDFSAAHFSQWRKKRNSQHLHHLRCTKLQHMGFLAVRADKGSAHQSAKSGVFPGQEIRVQERVNMVEAHSGQRDSLKHWKPRKKGEKRLQRESKKHPFRFWWRKLVWMESGPLTTAVQSPLTSAFPQETQEVWKHAPAFRWSVNWVPWWMAFKNRLSLVPKFPSKASWSHGSPQHVCVFWWV